MYERTLRAEVRRRAQIRRGSTPVHEQEREIGRSDGAIPVEIRRVRPRRIPRREEERKVRSSNGTVPIEVG